MTIQIHGINGLIEQYAPIDVRYIGTAKGKDIDKLDKRYVFKNLDMDDLKSRSSYLVVEMRNPFFETHVYTDDCIALVKGE